MYEQDKSDALNHFLLVLGDRLPFVFDKPGQKLQAIDFGTNEDDQNIAKKFLNDEEFKICNAQVALNSQFFIIGWTKNKKKLSDVNRTNISNQRSAIDNSFVVSPRRANQTEM